MLPMMAAALMTTACSSDDDSTSVSPKPAADQTVKTIPYTVTVGQGTTTRASVASDDVTLKFAAGDKLYVQDNSGNVYACLDLESGTGAASATFSGDLYYTGSEPADGLMLNATLVGEKDQLAITSGRKVTGFKAYPTSGNICATMADAVAKFSKLQGSNTYGAKSFELSQETAFLKFKVILEDGTKPTDNAVAVTVKDGNSTLGTGTTVASGTEQFVATYAEFVLPVKGGTSISINAKMWVGSVGTPVDESIAFGASSTKTLNAGYVYTVEKTKDFVRLWANGPVWATKNLGATKVTDAGDYYQWGNTTPVPVTATTLGWENYLFRVSGYTTGNIGTGDYQNHGLKLNKYVPTAYPAYWSDDATAPDNKLVLEEQDDAAFVGSNGYWRMPTETVFCDSEGLLKYTSYKWSTVNSINGGAFTGNTDGYKGKALFLPAAGFWGGTSLYYQGEYGGYWSSSLDASNPGYSRTLTFKSDNNASMSSGYRYGGRSVRPVHN